MKVHRIGSNLAVVITCMSAGRASGQCMHWDAGVGMPPYSSAVNRMCTHDPGTGRVLYAASGDAVYSWTGSAWTQVGLTFDNSVGPLCEYDDGAGVQLFAGGAFEANTLGTPMRNIAKFVGGVWQEVGGGFRLRLNSWSLYSPWPSSMMEVGPSCSVVGHLSPQAD